MNEYKRTDVCKLIRASGYTTPSGEASYATLRNSDLLDLAKKLGIVNTDAVIKPRTVVEIPPIAYP